MYHPQCVSTGTIVKKIVPGAVVRCIGSPGNIELLGILGSGCNGESAEIECFDETAWAAQCQPGLYRFVDKGNWATYIKYNLGAAVTPCCAVKYPIYAGQHYRAGTLYVYDKTMYQPEGECGPGRYGTLYVKYATYGGSDYKDGYIGAWKGFTEYHLHVADEPEGFNPVRTFSKKLGWGNPIPGQFEYSEEYDTIKTDTGWIEVEICGYENSDAYIAAHSVMWWCGHSQAK
ncbi:MAG: hypothetical protein PWR29_857 [Methanolobus sp.]|nr:hypothetical protein [Methanolobus sp.]MDK2911900.1 hypothetical protein [Methanolobus sp.]